MSTFRYARVRNDLACKASRRGEVRFASLGAAPPPVRCFILFYFERLITRLSSPLAHLCTAIGNVRAGSGDPEPDRLRAVAGASC